MSDGFDMVESRRNISTSNSKVTSFDKSEKLLNLAENNIPRIIQLASDLVEIRKMEVQSEAVLEKMREDRRLIQAEAEAYCMKKNADTNDVVQRMNIVRDIMNDFYSHSNGQITSEDFRQIITEVVNQMGRVANGK